MSILIRGMEMPTSCDECRIMVFEDTNCVPELFCGCPIVFKAHPQGVGHRPDYCPLVEAPKWIPVTERLPEENGHYLVHAVGNGYCSTYIALWNGRFRANFEMPVKYWMPLPEPPESEGE